MILHDSLVRKKSRYYEPDELMLHLYTQLIFYSLSLKLWILLNTESPLHQWLSILKLKSMIRDACVTTLRLCYFECIRVVFYIIIIFGRCISSFICFFSLVLCYFQLQTIIRSVLDALSLFASHSFVSIFPNSQLGVE